MNVFEDLITELKQEKLLEDTVIDDFGASSSDSELVSAPISDMSSDDDFADEVIETDSFYNSDDENDLSIDKLDGANEPEIVEDPVSDMIERNSVAQIDSDQDVRPLQGKEFFKKRAETEVSNLQMVEHVLTGIEREYLKIIPRIFDDFNTKKALHTFLHVAENVNSEEHAKAEFELLRETEEWCSSLAERDKNIPVSNLRLFCENSRPALSSQALLALAKFYRNLPYTEAVRAKFDFVITKLFTRPAENDGRVCLFNSQETFAHITKLYGEWSSVPLYSVDEHDSNVLLAALSFEDLAVEAESAPSFDHLINLDFFGRLRTLKESISEFFFAPNVTAAAIESNVRVGNAYVKLITQERKKMDSDSIQSKYADLDGRGFSDATARTLDLQKILSTPLHVPDEPVRPVHVSPPEPDPGLRLIPREPEPTETQVETVVQAKPKITPGTIVNRLKENARNVNKYFLVFSMTLIAASVGIYIWANYLVTESVPSSRVAQVSFGDDDLKAFVKVAKLSGDNLYVHLNPTWDALPKERRSEILQNMFKESGSIGSKQVNLITSEGKIAGFASENRLEIIMP